MACSQELRRLEDICKLTEGRANRAVETLDAARPALATGRIYVNIADVSITGWNGVSEFIQPKTGSPLWRRPAAHPTAPRPSEDPAVMELVELFFFAYRDFVGDADRLLENYGFGRAHHRVLHFVDRRPGLTIAALLDILKITKQSLNRVLKQLLDAGFVEARPGAIDRRQRLLFLTPRGAQLARELTALQAERFRRVLAELPESARASAAQFLFAMIDSSERERVRGHLSAARAGAPR